MDDQKNEIIIKEIKFWQKTKLIPDQYCLFLLRFYLKDEKEGPKLPKRLLFLMFWFFTFMMIISVSFFAFHFTQFSLSVQIAIFSLYALYFFSLALFFRYRVELLTTIFSVLFSSFICFSVILLYVLHRWDMSILLILLLSVSLLWMISARFLFKVELIFAGLLLFFVVFAAAQIEYMTSLPFWMMQFFWLPIAGGMIFFAYRWLNNLQSARFIFISGLIAFIGPECVTLFFADAPRWILQILLSLKLTTVASYLFLTRKEWRRFWIKEF